MATKGQGRENILRIHLQNKMITSDKIKQRSLNTFLNEASTKFDKGQQEHGGLLTDRDCFMEMRAEIVDLWHYYVAEEIRREERERYISELESEVVRLRSLLGGSVSIIHTATMATPENGAAA